MVKDNFKVNLITEESEQAVFAFDHIFEVFYQSMKKDEQERINENETIKTTDAGGETD